MSGRRRSASLSQPVFRDDYNDNSIDISLIRPDDSLPVLGLAGNDDLPPPSRTRVTPNPSTTAEQPSTTSTTASPFAVQVSSNRSKPDVRLTTPSLSIPPTATSEEDAHPLSRSAFLLGLKAAGYLEPLETSRNTIKQRFNHSLEKQHFKANLYAFLEHAGVARLGESMIRFVGTEEPHSPFVSVFVTAPIRTTEDVKIYAADSSNTPSVNGTSTQWNFLVKKSDADCEWSCKAKRFWAVRVLFEGPKSTDVVPATIPSTTTPTRPRGVRRDTFHREIDLDVEIEKRDKEEEEEEKDRLKQNTKKNSARPSDSPAIHIDTKNTAPVNAPLEEKPLRTPTTPTVLEATRQLAQSVVASLPPSMQQLPATMSTRIRHWFDQSASQGGDLEEQEEIDSEEERRRREKRRRRRERRRREEEELARAISRDRDEDDEDEVERKARKEERRRRRAERG